jgi:hypothetical protein
VDFELGLATQARFSAFEVEFEFRWQPEFVFEVDFELRLVDSYLFRSIMSSRCLDSYFLKSILSSGWQPKLDA